MAKENGLRYRGLCVLCSFILALTGCGAAGGPDEIELIDEMSQIDFDIDYPVGQITQGVIVTQDFVSNAPIITQIWLYGATYMRENTATVDVVLFCDKGSAPAGEDETGKDGEKGDSTKDGMTQLATWTIDSSKMEDNSIIKLDVPESELNMDMNGVHCLIEISSPDGEPEKSPTFWMTEEDVYPDGSLGINGYAQYNDLWFQVIGKDNPEM
ncbi:MAG: hypothetical protein K6G12_06295 [Lachnospiraceae bacterium]|nr:hypothetical protein [Lachnospiraceae bacterium]